MLHFRILGQLSLERDGEPIAGFDTQRKGLAILAILAVERQATRDRLMALLWPESDSARARGSLKQALHQLRQTLGTRELITGSSSLRLDPAAITTDAGQFLAALGHDDGKAVAIYGGPLLDGVHLGGPSELEQWADEKRADLGAKWAAALERLAAEAEKKGDPRAAAELWKRLQAYDTTDSRITLRLMLALEAAGRKAAALQEANDHQRRLREEWDLAADPAVDQLTAQLRAGSLAPSYPPMSPYYEQAGVGASLSSQPGAHAALGAPASAAATTPSRRAPRFALVAGALIVVAAAAGMLWPGPDESSTAASDPNLVAVPPFDAFDPSVALWSEGLADVLIRDLDGAGPLRTVSAAASFRDWGGNADRTSATALGRRTGAGIVVFGSVSRLDSASVALRAWILERGSDRYVAELEVRGPESGMGRLADSLSRSILVALGRDRPIASARRVTLASRSIVALREFLRGEQFYRRGSWDSAMAHYARAVEADTTMALAYKRMSMVSGWGAPAPGGVPGDEYVMRAIALNHGLAPRDSLILAADSMVVASVRAIDATSTARYLHRGVAALEEASQRYPDDPDVFYHLAEARVHWPMPEAGTPAAALDAFEHAIALDPEFLPAYEHTVELAFLLGQPELARRYARDAALLAADNQESSWHLLLQVLDSGPAAPSTVEALSRAPAQRLLRVADYLRWSTDSAETTIATLRALQAAGPAPATDGVLASNPVLKGHELASALAFRGHLEAAADLAVPLPAEDRARYAGAILDPFVELSLLGAVPDSVAATVFLQAFAPGSDWGQTGFAPRFLRGAPWWFARRDTSALSRLVERASRVADTATSRRASARGQYLAAAAAGYLALAKGDSAAAARIFSDIPDMLCRFNGCLQEKLALAQLLLADGKPSEAASVLDRWGKATSYSTLTSRATPCTVFASLLRARAAKALADTATARRNYQFVLDAWRDADAQLQPWVAEARAGFCVIRGCS